MLPNGTQHHSAASEHQGDLDIVGGKNDQKVQHVHGTEADDFAIHMQLWIEIG